MADTTRGPLEFPASFDQERMWFFHRMDPGNPTYNVPLVLRLRGGLDAARLARALHDVTVRQEILRTTYGDGPDGALRQFVHDTLPPAWDTDVLDTPPAEPVMADPRVRAAVRATVRAPFDLAAGPPLRARLVRLGPDDHLLVLCLHHIATDGWSLGLLVAELDAYYRADGGSSTDRPTAPGGPGAPGVVARPAGLAALEIQYADYAEWQRSTLTPEVLAGRFAHWRQVLGGRPAPLTLPFDRPRPATPSFRGARVDFDLPGPTARALRELARRHGASPHMTLLAAWGALLHRYGAGRRIVVGTLLANRDNPQLAPLMGLFVNTLPVAFDVAGDAPFTALLADVRAAALDVQAHQDTPVDGIVRALGASGDDGGNPLFHVLFALQNFAGQRLELGGLDVRRVDDEEESTRFDLELHVWEHPDRLHGSLVFDTDLFDRATAERLAAHYAALLDAVVADPARRVDALPLRPGHEERRLRDTMRAGSVSGWTLRDAGGGVPPEGVPADVLTADGAATGRRGVLAPDGTVRLLDAVGPDGRVPALVTVDGTDVRPAEVEEALLRAAPALADVVVVPRRTAPGPRAEAAGSPGPDEPARDTTGRASGPAPGPTQNPSPGPTSRPAPDPAVGPAPEPVDEPASGSVNGAASAPPGLASGPAGEPASEPAPDPVAGPAPEPVNGAASAPHGLASGLADEPASEPAPDSVVGPAPEPVGEPAPDPAVGPASGPVDEPASRPTADPAGDTPTGGGQRAGGVELVAYAVPDGPLDLAALGRLLPVRGTVVPVSRLPLTARGEVDVPALLRLPVADAAEAARLEERLRRAAPGRRLAVLPTAPAPSPPALVAVPAPPPAVDDTPEAAARTGREDPDGAPGSSGSGRGRPAALADGGPATPPGARTLGDALLRAARSGHGDIVLVDDTGARNTLGYGELRERALRTLAGLHGLGLRAGDRVLLQLDEHAGFLTVLWACLLGGLVAAPLAVPADHRVEDAQTERLYGAWRMLGEPVVVADAARVEGLRTSAAARGLSALRAFGADELAAAADLAQPHPARPDDPVLLMLTSGSTGRPKAVVLRHRNVLARSAATAAANGLRAADVSVNWLPLDHVGGVVMFHLRDVFLGCRQVHAPTRWVLQDPLRWPQLAHEMRATTTWAPNFAFGLVADRAAELPARARGWDLSRLRFVMNAGEAIVPRVARRWLEVLAPYGLPADAMRPAWGMSETSSAMTYSDRFRLDSTSDGDAFVEVGAPLPGTAIRIVAADQDTSDQGTPGQDTSEQDPREPAAGPRVLAEGETGRLQVRGTTVTTGYDAAPEQNAAAFTADGWFDTGDLGRISGGRLTLTGRAKDVVILGGVNHHSHEIESVVEQLDCVEPSFTAAVAVRPAGAAGDELAVFFCPRGAAGPAEAARRVRAAVREGVGVNARHVVAVDRDEIPKTEIGKIRRAALRTRFEAGGFAGRVSGGHERVTTVPDHFHRPVWLPRALPEPAAAAAGEVLLIPDRHGLAAALARTLAEAGHRVETADPETYAAPGPRPGGRTPGSGPGGAIPAGQDPRGAEGGADAGDAPAGGAPGAGAGTAGRVVVDLRAYGGPAGPGPQEARAERHGLLGLARAVHGAAAVYVVTSHARRVSAGDPPAQERAPLGALALSLGHERPGTRVAHVDLPPGDLVSDAALLAAEVARLPRDRAVAHRAGRRLVRALAPADAPDLPGAVAAAGTSAGPSGAGGGFRRGGRYLVTGGSGGVGRLVAAELAGGYGADVVCVSRGAAEPPDGGGRFDRPVTYVAADVGDVEAMRGVVHAAEERWGAPLDGVLHLAGGYREGSLDACSARDLDEDLAAKAGGARVLHELLRDRPGLLFVSFSSVNGLFGGASVGGYAAANAYLDELAVHQRLECGLRAYSLAWSMWDETGMSTGYPLKRLTQDRGYRVLPPRQALASLAVALGRDAPHQLVGLDPARPWIASQSADAPLSAPRLTVYAEEASAADGAEGADRFGVPHVVRHVVVDALPVDAIGGGVDRSALAAGTSGASAQDAGAGGDLPRPGLESVIAEVWAEVLGVADVTRDASFFDLGGGSLEVTRVHGLLQARLGRRLAMADLFRRPTLPALARALAPADGSSGTDGASAPNESPDDSPDGGRGRARAGRRLRAAAERGR